MEKWIRNWLKKIKHQAERQLTAKMQILVQKVFINWE